MTANEYRQKTYNERVRHNQAIEERNARRDIKRDEERRSRERQYRNNRLFSNVISAPQSTSHVLRSILAYCLIIMLVVNFARVSTDMPPLTVTSFFETMANCPDFDFSSVVYHIPSDVNLPSWLFSFLNFFIDVAWNWVVVGVESLVNIFAFISYFTGYLLGWSLP